MSFLVSIEGNIGSGKSTLLEELKNDYIVVLENVSEWTQLQDENNLNLIQIYYKEPTRYSFMFQAYVLISRLNHIMKAIESNPGKVIISERCHLTDYHVFVEQLAELKDLSPIEKAVYDNMHQLISSLVKVPLVGVIYNRTSVDVCKARIDKRSRPGEEAISRDYLQALHDKHETYLEAQKDIEKLIIDGDIDLEDKALRQETINQIKEFIKRFQDLCR